MKIITTSIENDPVGLNLLSSSAIYSAIEKRDKALFVEKGYISAFEIGEHLIKEDEIGDKFFIIKSGEVEIYTEKDKKRVTLAILTVGACIGEGSLITGCRRTANVQCLTDVDALVFNFSDIEPIIEKNPKLKKLLISLIEKRAESTAEKIISCI
ncbi:MAG: cyclic nucleotide-binding domain-containing protein [Myxococcota bacterium]